VGPLVGLGVDEGCAVAVPFLGDLVLPAPAGRNTALSGGLIMYVISVRKVSKRLAILGHKLGMLIANKSRNITPRMASGHLNFSGMLNILKIIVHS